jgi:hypothetical protein
VNHRPEITRPASATYGAAPAQPGAALSTVRHDVGRPAAHGTLLDLLDRVLDKGVVVAGDITVSLLDIELLTIKIRLLIASVDKAKEMGIDWWARDPQLSGAARRQQQKLDSDDENRRLRERIRELENRLAALPDPEKQNGGRPRAPAVQRGSRAG